MAETQTTRERLREACMEVRLREREELFDIKDMNCYAAGYCSGMIAAVDELLACLDEEDQHG